MGSDVQKLFGVKRDKRSPQHKSEIEAANAMKPVDFSTSHGSQGVTNPNYAEYVKLHPDLMANYNAMGWKDKGVTLAEYGAMHWNKHGRAEGRTMPGIGGGGGSEPSGGGFSGGLIETGDGLGPYPAYNKYFPMLTTAYEAPGFQDWSAYMTPGVFSGDGGALYQPWAGRDFSYTPPEFSVGPVQYYAPVSPLEIIFEEEMSEEENNGSTGTNPLTDLDMRGGKGPGDVGYGTSSPEASKGSTSSGVASQTTGLGEPDNVSPSAEWGGGHTSGKGKGPLGGGGWE